MRTCERCGIEMVKRYRDSAAQWEAKRFCSRQCKDKSAARVPIEERFWRYAVKRELNECWPWVGNADKYGYGQICTERGRSPMKAYRLSYEMHKGPIPDGMVIRHKCDNPNCVNPDHLETGTQKDNAQDMVRRGRLNPKVLNNLKRDRVLTNEMAADAALRYSNGESMASIARDFGVDRTTVSNYIKGKRSWRAA